MRLPRERPCPRRERYAVSRSEKRSNFAADFRALYPLTQLEAQGRQNVWQSGAQNRAEMRMSFPVPGTASLIGRAC
jgi:hypothetical protein